MRPVNPASFPTSTPEDNLLEIPVILLGIGLIGMAIAIIAHAVLTRRGATKTPPPQPKQTS